LFKFYIIIVGKNICIFIVNLRILITKLTLSLEETVIKKAKCYARQTGRSLSELVETYLENITAENYHPKEISPKLQKLVGAIKLPTDFDEKKELRAYFEDKHL